MEVRMNDQDISRFWRQLLEPMFCGTMDPTRADRYLRDLTTFHLRFPDGELRRPSMRELRRAVRAYRDHGFGEWEDRP